MKRYRFSPVMKLFFFLRREEYRNNFAAGTVLAFQCVDTFWGESENSKFCVIDNFRFSKRTPTQSHQSSWNISSVEQEQKLQRTSDEKICTIFRRIPKLLKLFLLWIFSDCPFPHFYTVNNLFLCYICIDSPNERMHESPWTVAVCIRCDGGMCKNTAPNERKIQFYFQITSACAGGNINSSYMDSVCEIILSIHPTFYL